MSAAVVRDDQPAKAFSTLQAREGAHRGAILWGSLNDSRMEGVKRLIAAAFCTSSLSYRLSASAMLACKEQKR